MKRFFLFALVVTMFAACVTDETQDVAVELAPETLTVSFEDTDSRIQLDNGKTVWTKGDLASVFYRSNANQQWQYQGETGDRTGELKRVNAGNATEIMKRVVVVYPYSESYYINTDTYNVEASLPASQSYLKDSYGVGGNIMISQSEFNQFSLKSVCGWLKLQLTGNGEIVKSIKLKGNAGEQVAGLIYINSATAEATLAAEMGGADDNENTAGGNLVFDDTILTEVTLDCGEGVELGAEPTAFFIALPPQTFAQGLTIEIEDTNAFKMTKSTDKEVIISRNAIQPMAELGYERIIPETWKIRYTATAKVSPYKTDVFGANIVSNEWDETTGEGVITFDGEVTSIGNYAFSQCSRLTGIIIPDSVTEIGEYAFNYSGLTNITIPTNVETIGDLAFGDCPIKEFKGKFAEDNGRCLVINGELRFGVLKGITEYTIPEGVTKIGHRAFVRSSLESIIIANDVKKIGPDSFYYCSNLKTVVIGDGVTEMSSTVFDHCENLTNVTLGNSLTNIGYCAFYYCKSLQSITIPDSVTKIDTYAFYGCSSLTTITIPQNVSTILSGAFQYCPNLKTVYCQATTPPYTDSYSNYASYWPTFNDNAEGRVIYVPRNSVNAYKAAGGWKNYSNDIVGYSF